ncbi:MAG TPA: recombinase family protein [Clostridiales bacterium]|nr:recombinase family protein [Clostridiales bacterium]
MQKQITKIPATISRTTRQVINSNVKRRVAAYARVSTDQEEQLTSYEAQVDYYTNYIKSRDDWEFVKVYADEGISGCNTKKRHAFQAMIKDALDGKIDLILTKSVSRFARNTVDSLSNIRNLKEHNVEVYFEKENIYTFDGKGELLLTIMASISQEEARSISENVTWGQRKRFADGKVSLAYSRFLGYDKGEDGKLVINEEEAKTIKLIFKYYLNGYSFHTIANLLTEQGLKTPAGKDKWSQTTIKGILTNEKYKGDALLQKSYTSDFLTKKQKKNNGEIPQYYVENNHEPIISKEVFEIVQNEIKKRTTGSRYSGVGIFASKIKCKECGSWYGAKIWHSTDKYKKVIYRCNHKYDKEKVCETPHLTEEEIKAIAVEAINKVVKHKKAIIENVEQVVEKLCDVSKLNKEKEKTMADLNLYAEMQQNLIEKNTMVAQNQKKYNDEYESITSKYETAKQKYDEVCEKISNQIARKEKMEFYINSLKKVKGAIKEFDEAVFAGLIDYIEVGKNNKTVYFKGGNTIEI